MLIFSCVPVILSSDVALNLHPYIFGVVIGLLCQEWHQVHPQRTWKRFSLWWWGQKRKKESGGGGWGLWKPYYCQIEVNQKLLGLITFKSI